MAAYENLQPVTLERAKTQVCCYPDYLYKGQHHQQHPGLRAARDRQKKSFQLKQQLNTRIQGPRE
ncbi:Hypothetical protein FKW44_000349, partial [Caligus rogercresseyi]